MYKLSFSGVTFNGSFIPNDPKNRDWIEYQKWLDEGNIPESQYTIRELKTLKIAKVKQEASKRIFDLNSTLPIWKQMNFAARAIELIEKESLTSEEQSELDYFKDTWNQVKVIRKASNLIEDEINNSDNPLDIDVPNHGLWP